MAPFPLLRGGAYPPDSNYLHRPTSELCGNVFWARFNQRFHLLNPDQEKYVAEIEKSIYNVALPNQVGSTSICYHAMAMGRKDASWDVTTRSRNTCCEGQGTRLFGSLPEYIYSIAPDGIYIDLFAPSEISWKQGRSSLKLTMQTQFPKGNSVALKFLSAAPVKSKFRVRVPGWAMGPMVIAVNGKTFATGTPGTYATLDRTWKEGDTITFNLPAEVTLTEYQGAEQNEKQPRYAVQYGPVLLAAVGIDADRPEISLSVSAEDLKKGLRPEAGKPLHFSIASNPYYEFIPYYEVRMDQTFTSYPVISSGTFTPAKIQPNDIALASKGAKVTSDSEYEPEKGCTQKAIDGVIADIDDLSNRWHSSITAPHPHWIEVKLPKPTAFSKIIVHFADPQGHPLNFQGTVQMGGKTKVVFDETNYKKRLSYEATLKGSPVSDTFRFTIRDSANAVYPNAAQVSEIEIIPVSVVRKPVKNFTNWR